VLKGKNYRRHKKRDDFQYQDRSGPWHRNHLFDHGEAAKDLKLKKGNEAYAIMKASEVIIGKE
jgi:hypothetical protein